MIIVLGIETSCDETSVAIVGEGREIFAHTTYSQIKEHEKFGGVVPEVAARSHLEKIEGLVSKVINDSGLSLSDISCVGGTAGPGLIGGVIVGTVMTKALSFALDKPYVAVNHLEGHALTVRLCEDVDFPYVLLLISGGHTQILVVHGVGNYEVLGETLDDALGETFDKIAKVLKLECPGGVGIEKMAVSGNPDAFILPKPFYKKPGCDFSFSGLKTAARECIQKQGVLEDQQLFDFCASFQKTICDVLEDRMKNALKILKSRDLKLKTLVAAGGVAANKQIRLMLETLSSENDLNFVAPPLNLCTDNGAMIAWAALERFKLGMVDDLTFAARPRWPLEELKHR